MAQTIANPPIARNTSRTIALPARRRLAVSSKHLGCLAFLAVLGLAVPSSSAAATTTVVVSGVVSCEVAGVAGVYVGSDIGGTTWANVTRSATDNKAAYYQAKVQTVLASSLYLRVGCGRLPNGGWQTDSRTPSTPQAVTRDITLNAICNEVGEGARCKFPFVVNLTGAPSAAKLPTQSRDTCGARYMWRLNTGGDINWLTPAALWADSAQGVGWTVTATPMPRSIMVIPSPPGHAAWVNTVAPDGQSANITDTNLAGKWFTHDVPLSGLKSVRYILAPAGSMLALPTPLPDACS